MEPLTIRIEPSRVVMSTDDGRTVEVDDDAAASIRAAAGEVSSAVRADDWTLGLATAATLAMLAEASLVKPRDTGRTPSLPHAPARGESVRIGQLARPNKRPFSDVLATRRSRRAFGPMTLPALACVLVPSARVQGWWEAPDGYTATERPTPSAGGRHPLELAVLALSVDGLEPGLWSFDAATCDLVRAELADTVRDAALARVRAAAECEGASAAAIFVVADFERTLSRYPSGSSLVLRDAGALLATMQLAANAAGLASCIVGTAGTLAYHTGAGVTADVGALLLGS